MYRFLNFIYRFYPLAIAMLLAAGATWLEYATRSPESSTDAVVTQTPDFIAETVRVTGFAKDGKLSFTLVSPRLTHLPAIDLTHVEQPQLQFIAQGRQMWINANHGKVGPKGERIDFTGNVEAEREGAPSDPPMHLSSEQLTVWPQEQRAASDVPVRLTQGEVRANANGFEADNVFGAMKLSGKVRMYLPSRHQRKS
ncbi:MAG: LPS export ABC transporter periplasmic protein LptC [Betaproteobacteria bacterium]|nr:LPS export ABC transporter periplasmic protein LptC [Betaproteobacteria bacterium]